MPGMCLIGLNTAIEPYSFAIVENGSVLDSVITSSTYTVSEQIMLAIDERLSRLSKQWTDVSGMVVVEGPGSYTGIRIGVSFAKTVAMVQTIPLVGVDVLTVLATQALFDKGVAMSVVKARKQEYNTRLFSFVENKVCPLSNQVCLSHDETVAVLRQFEAPIRVVGQVSALQETVENSELIFMEMAVTGEAVIKAGLDSHSRDGVLVGDYRQVVPKYSHFPHLVTS